MEQTTPLLLDLNLGQGEDGGQIDQPSCPSCLSFNTWNNGWTAWNNVVQVCQVWTRSCKLWSAAAVGPVPRHRYLRDDIVFLYNYCKLKPHIWNFGTWGFVGAFLWSPNELVKSKLPCHLCNKVHQLQRPAGFPRQKAMELWDLYPAGDVRPVNSFSWPLDMTSLCGGCFCGTWAWNEKDGERMTCEKCEMYWNLVKQDYAHKEWRDSW